jgi:hypothetical protein
MNYLKNLRISGTSESVAKLQELLLMLEYSKLEHDEIITILKYYGDLINNAINLAERR